MNHRHSPYLAKAWLASGLLGLSLLVACTPSNKAPATGASAAVAGKPALSVELIKPTRDVWPLSVQATGNVAAWQEAVIGSEVSGMRITQVLVNVGDTVRKGQVLARLNPSMVEVDKASSQAAVAEAEAALAQAQLNAERAARLSPTGALSKQEVVQYETQKKTAQAKLKVAQAQLAAQGLRLSYATLRAPDDGVISARTATEGAVVQTGTELFRLIRQQRLEWRAELKAEDLLRVKPGQQVSIAHPLGEPVEGKVRQIAPSVDTSSRNGLVYVDLPTGAQFKTGMFVSGTFELAKTAALHVPQAALVSRDGSSYAFKVDNASRVQAVKVTTGRVQGDSIEVLGGLSEQDSVVAGGVGFLKSGDLVRVVPAAESAQSK